MIEPKYHIAKSLAFKKGYKLAKKQGKNLSLLAFGIDQLAQDIPLPANWKDHQLKGNMRISVNATSADSVIGYLYTRSGKLI